MNNKSLLRFTEQSRNQNVIVYGSKLEKLTRIDKWLRNAPNMVRRKAHSTAEESYPKIDKWLCNTPNIPSIPSVEHYICRRTPTQSIYQTRIIMYPCVYISVNLTNELLLNNWEKMRLLWWDEAHLLFCLISVVVCVVLWFHAAFNAFCFKSCVCLEPFCSTFNKLVSYFVGNISRLKFIRQLENSVNRDQIRPSTVHLWW